MKRILSLLVLCCFGLVLSAQTVTELIDAAEKLRAAQNEPAALTKYVEALKKDPKNYEALVGASFLYARIGNRLENEEEKAAYFRNAERFADEAVKVNPNDAEGYYVVSVAKGRIAEISSAKERVASSTAIKNNVDMALKLNPKHPGAWHVLGKWNIKVANLNFAERAAADLLFGGLPPGASNQNSINAYLNAIKYRPDYILYHYDLAGAYYFDKQIEKCKEELRKVISMPPVTPDDPHLIADAKEQLKNM